MIAICNFCLFFINSKIGAFLGIVCIMVFNHVIPPFYSFTSEPVNYFFEFRSIPLILSNALVSGFFPLVPFMAWAFWGALYIRLKDKRLSLIPLGAGIFLSLFEPLVYSQYGNVYSASMILITMGVCSLLLEALRMHRIPFLNLYGRYAWRMTFWRYFLLYMPFVWTGKFRAFNNTSALIFAIVLSLAQVLLSLISYDELTKFTFKLKHRLKK